jgi:hypothetical protein
VEGDKPHLKKSYHGLLWALKLLVDTEKHSDGMVIRKFQWASIQIQMLQPWMTPARGLDASDIYWQSHCPELWFHLRKPICHAFLASLSENMLKSSRCKRIRSCRWEDFGLSSIHWLQGHSQNVLKVQILNPLKYTKRNENQNPRKTAQNHFKARGYHHKWLKRQQCNLCGILPGTHHEPTTSVLVQNCAMA